MLLLKTLNSKAMRARYRSYRRVNFVYAVLFFLSFLLAIVLMTRLMQTPQGIELCERFRLHYERLVSRGAVQFALYGFCTLMPFVLLAMAMGITVYAPFVGALSSVLTAVLSGGYVRLLLGVLANEGKLLAFFAYFGLSLFLFPLLVMIFAFACSVSLYTFAPARVREPGAQKMFGGSLFCAPYFARTINLRFLSTYLLLFLACSIGLFLICLAQGAVCLALA